MWGEKTVKRIKSVLFCVMLLVAALYALNRWLLYSSFDRTVPEITFGQELLEISVDAPKEELLSDVKAVDARDGDVTDTVIIESLSGLLNNQERLVTYAAFDRDNHVTKAERRIRYTDYTSPRFSLDAPLEASSASEEISEILAPLHASDCIDGDLTDQIVVMDSSLSSLTSESLSMQYEVQVTNSCGDVVSLVLPVKIRMSGEGNFGGLASIELTDYLIYRKVGDAVNYGALLESAVIRGEEYGMDAVQVQSDLDSSKPGVYTATYSIEQEEEKASVDLLIVVEE